MKKTFLSIFLLFAVVVSSLSCKTVNGKISADGRFVLIPVDTDKVVKTIEQYQKEHNYWFATNYFSVPFNEPLQIFVSKEAVTDVGRKNISDEGIDQDTSANVSIYIGYKKDSQWTLNRYEGKQEIIYNTSIYSFEESNDIAALEKEFYDTEALYQKRLALLAQDHCVKTKSINTDYETHSDEEINEVLDGIRKSMIVDLSRFKIESNNYFSEPIIIKVSLFNFNKFSYFNVLKRKILITYMCNNEVKLNILRVTPKFVNSNDNIIELNMTTRNFKLLFLKLTENTPSNDYINSLRTMKAGLNRFDQFFYLIKIDLKELKIK